MKIKTFDLSEEASINEFLAKVRPLQSGITIKDGKVTLAYADDEVLGITKKDAVAVIASELGKLQQNRISAELDLRYWKTQSILKLGGVQKQEDIEVNIRNAEANLEMYDLQCRQYRDLIAEIERDEYVL